MTRISLSQSVVSAMKFSVIWAFLFLFFSQGAYAQSTESSRLFIKKIDVQKTYVYITYELNYPGFVELHLTNPEGKKVWITGSVADQSGSHSIRISRMPMEKGKRYSFILKYKGKDYSGSFYNEEKDS